MYNHHMGSGDIANQIQTSYDINHHHRRIWKPLFYYAFHTTVCNAYKLYKGAGYGDTKHSGHATFRKQLATSLISTNDLTPPDDKPEPFSPTSQLDPSLKAEHPYFTIFKDPQQSGSEDDLLSNPPEVINLPTEYAGRSNYKPCTSCQKNGRYESRKPLVSSPNRSNRSRIPLPSKRTPRTRYRCQNCLQFLCVTLPCTLEHICQKNN
jgi:hypothetical protein